MLKSTGVITSALLEALRLEFALDWYGIHGVRHWGRVRANGLELASLTGANARVVELFAVLHDSCRFNDGHDPSHGLRAAQKAARLGGTFFSLDAPEMDSLCEACISHSEGFTESSLTVQVCWDADRLDLGRVGIEPLPAKLCTVAARDPAVIALAYRRSLAHWERSDPGV